MVTFNGVPVLDYTTELELDETLTLGRPDGLLPTDIFIYDVLVLFTLPNGIENWFGPDLLWTNTDIRLVVPNGEPADYYSGNNFPNFFGVPSIILKTNRQEDTLDIENRYLVDVTIERGETVFGPCNIDPKIRIKINKLDYNYY